MPYDYWPCCCQRQAQGESSGTGHFMPQAGQHHSYPAACWAKEPLTRLQGPWEVVPVRPPPSILPMHWLCHWGKVTRKCWVVVDGGLKLEWLAEWPPEKAVSRRSLGVGT